MRDECGIHWEKAKIAKRTYGLMKRLIEAGFEADPKIKLHRRTDGSIGGWERTP